MGADAGRVHRHHVDNVSVAELDDPKASCTVKNIFA